MYGLGIFWAQTFTFPCGFCITVSRPHLHISLGGIVASRRAWIVLVGVVCVNLLFTVRPLRASDEKHTSQSKEPEEQVYDIGGDVLPPKLIHVVEPEFNPKSEEAYVSGTIRLQIVVTKEGAVKNPKVLAGPNERQNKAAMDAVLQWRFKPASRKGEAVNVRATVEVNFHLL